MLTYVSVCYHTFRYDHHTGMITYRFGLITYRKLSDQLVKSPGHRNAKKSIETISNLLELWGALSLDLKEIFAISHFMRLDIFYVDLNF